MGPARQDTRVCVRVLACLPLLQVEGNRLSLNQAGIVKIPFEEWLVLEGQQRSAPYDKLRRHYRGGPPVFWEHWLEVESSLLMPPLPEMALSFQERFQPVLTSAVRALHWYVGTAMIHPLRSIIYFDIRQAVMQTNDGEIEQQIHDRGVPRVCGESDKFFLFSNQRPSVYLRQEDADDLSQMLEFVKASEAIWSQGRWQQILESLEICGTPGLAVESQVVLLVGALEALIMPDIRRDLRSTFRQRMCLLLAGQHDDPGEIDHVMGTAYQLRSDLVHGKPPNGWRRLSEPGEAFIQRLHRLAIQAICRLLQWEMRGDALPW